MSNLSKLIVDLDNELCAVAKSLALNHEFHKEYNSLCTELAFTAARLLGIKELSDEIKARKVNDKNSKN